MIIEGDCLEVMKTFPENHFSAIVTDPPYGLKFMGKDWDYGIPGKHFWEEALRISKPGAYLLSFGGTRTFHRLTCSIEDAGWQIRDCLMWLYGSGFPKSHNHFGFEGYGTALKPAWEPCILAMKPLDGTFRQNAEKWGQAGINIDGCRIGVEGGTAKGTFPNEDSKSCYGNGLNGTCEIVNLPKGRWPANLILDEEAGKMLDGLTGILKSGKTTDKETKESIFGKKMMAQEASYGGASRFFYCAKASASEKNEGLEGLPESSIRRKDRLAGSHDIFNTEGCGRNTDNKPLKNSHPTVKPLSLMEYLLKLIAPPKDALILDPFAGSGTTIVAAKKLGLEAIGIEKSAEYCQIARKRCEAEDAKPKQMDFFPPSSAID